MGYQFSTERKRQELKYYIDWKDYLYAKSILSKTMQQDQYQKDEEGYFVRSIYFDDIYNTSLNENLGSEYYRTKYRLRTYSFDQQWAKIEKKSKKGEYLYKKSTTISRSMANKMLNNSFSSSFLKKRNPTMNSLCFNLCKKYYHPVVTIDYIRDAFVKDNNLRISFDKNLRYNDTKFELYNEDLDTISFLNNKVVIMEIKYDKFYPAWLPNLLKLNCSPALPISKYLNARTKNNYFLNYI
ncbi:polyphosphate polymerase domain-containing protein [Candidatus Dojkabacteria bacterium]|uniref:Polyphosphate polymerase domain-containing protein n=1 Tax=Candidatus Dojkabacteria bacterium TaxID=2099670 RepID=A0A847VD59_9BACT|nr:polyphosphate polymerase domain-containing protein [Candidatus Dojkabacteria bacterium]